MAHQYQLLLHVLQVLIGIHALGELQAPGIEQQLFALSSSEEENTCIRIFLGQLADNLVHEWQGVFLAGMGSCWRNAYPLLEVLLWTDDGWQQIQVAAFLGEEGAEVYLHRITQTGKDVGLVLEGTGELFAYLIIMGGQLLTLRAVLVDMLHTVVANVEAHAQIV